MNLNQVGLAELILTGGWYIWWERRKFVHGEAIQQPMQSALSIASLTTNYKTAMKKSIKQREGWKRPPEGKLLINIDGSFREESDSGGTGVVIRDSKGTFIAGSCNYMEHVVDAPTSEVMALKEGLLLAQWIGCNGFIIHLDYMEVVETIRLGISFAAGAPIYDDCFLLWQDFEAISIEHCDREANMVAHEIARVALFLKDRPRSLR